MEMYIALRSRRERARQTTRGCPRDPTALTAWGTAATPGWPLQEVDQLHKIFSLLGTPDEAMWAGCSSLPDYRDSFPRWRPQSLAAAVPTLSHEGVDLLARMLVYTPQHRWGGPVPCMRTLSPIMHGGHWQPSAAPLQHPPPSSGPLTSELLCARLSATRITASAALDHPYFADIREQMRGAAAGGQ
jgi:hypothetical protein